MEKNIMNELYFGTGASSNKSYEGLFQVVETAVKQGIVHFDTAPSYRTEEILGTVIQKIFRSSGLRREDVFIQTKIDPWQMQEGGVRGHVELALGRMHLEYFDSLLIHWPVPEYLDDTWKVFCDLYKEGIVRKIGLCNLRARHILHMLDMEIVPQIIQIERNPLRTCAQEIEVCHEYGIEVQAYSPLCKMDERIANSTILMEIARKYKKSIGQIVLRWHLDTGVIPVFTSTKQSRIMEYTDIFSFHLK